MARNKSWYKIQAAADVPEIMIYGDIAEYGVSAGQFRADLMSIKSEEINLRINSRGGLVFEGVAIYNALKDHPAKITAHIDSLAASISAFIPMAADKIIMAKNARMMIHKAWGLVMGNADELRSMAVEMDDVDSIQIEAFSAKTGMSKQAMQEMLAEETWLTPQKAKEMRFIDEIAGESSVKAQFDLSPFTKVPEDVTALYGKARATERDIEQLLRDAGVSNSKAKAAIAAIKADHRDDETLEGQKMKEFLQAMIMKDVLTR